MNQDNQKKIESMNDEQFQMFFLLQYDRIDKLETKRENLSNYVLTVTAAIFTFGFTFLEELNIIALIFIIAINFAAIIFVSKTRPWV